MVEHRHGPPEVGKRISSPPTPSLSQLHERPGLSETYTTHIRPLNRQQIQDAKRGLTRYFSSNNNQEQNRSISETRAALLHDVQEENRRLFESSSEIGLVLDGRLGRNPDGWWGDMVEASRLVDTLKAAGKKVRIFTSRPDAFAGDGSDSQVSVVRIPDEVPGYPFHPWNQALLEFLQANQFGSDNQRIPFLFPANASMPVLVQLTERKSSSGKNNDQIQIANQHTINILASAVNNTSLALKNPTKYPGIMADQWASIGLHQIQALQVFAELIGVPNVDHWQSFPQAYVRPTRAARVLAAKVANDYKCFQGNGCSVLLHPGLAIDQQKVEKKGYPTERWQEVLKLLATQQVSNNMENLIIFKPINPDQSQQATKITEHIRQLGTPGLNIIEIPIGRDWSLGAFAAFLELLQQENGILLGVDSMPAGHLAPSLGVKTVVAGTRFFDPRFFAPYNDLGNETLTVLPPKKGKRTSDIEPTTIAQAFGAVCPRPK